MQIATTMSASSMAALTWSITTPAAKMSFVRPLVEGVIFQPRMMIWAVARHHRSHTLVVVEVIAVGALLVGCFVLGWLLTLTADVTLLDAYLATTPGGLYAVLPIAYGSGADTTFVLAVQGLRLFAMILAAPVVVRRLVMSAA